MTGDPQREDERVQKLSDEAFLRALFDLPALSEDDEDDQGESDGETESGSDYRVDGELR